MSDRIAIIGLGPRGLGALEALASVAECPIAVDIFDPAQSPGSGPNFDPAESPLCLLNIPFRDIEIDPPEWSGIGPFADFLEDPAEPDAFPPRSVLGQYLEARYQDLIASGRLQITHHPRCAQRVDSQDGDWHVTSDGRAFGPYREVLITIGQPPVDPDEQWAAWRQDAKGTMVDAYPAHALIQKAKGWSGKTVAIRGLGLSAFDVLRSLTTAQGGRFEDGSYLASGAEPERIVPFSLDGKPPFPKPETQALDHQFDPTTAETERFVLALEQAVVATPEAAKTAINAALAGPVARIISDDKVTEETVLHWLATEWETPGQQEDGAPLDILKHGIALAAGAEPPTIGYTVGQLWRKWQNELRRGYNPAQVPPETAQVLNSFDEGLKRYSYGPPVAASRELLALVDAGLVSLDHATDPDIGLSAVGWRIGGAPTTIEATVMIDAVLPPPDLEAVTDPMISALFDYGRLSLIADGLAARSGTDATLIDSNGVPVAGLALLGRLALGSVIAVDSLHDCFGEAATRWAAGVAERLRFKGAR